MRLVRFKRRRKWVDHLSSGRYKSLVVDGSNTDLKSVGDYVNLNLTRAKLVEGAPFGSALF